MKTFARVKNAHSPIIFPDSWSQEVQQLLRQIYQAEFEVYGASFEQEVLLIASLIDLNGSPVSLFLSADLTTDQQPEKLMQTLVDKVGLFFDQYFAEPVSQRDDLYEPLWQERQEGSITLYYKVSRENIRLTLEANRLLGEDSEI